jgi:hypothetical protein
MPKKMKINKWVGVIAYFILMMTVFSFYEAVGFSKGVNYTLKLKETPVINYDSIHYLRGWSDAKGYARGWYDGFRAGFDDPCNSGTLEYYLSTTHQSMEELEAAYSKCN